MHFRELFRTILTTQIRPLLYEGDWELDVLLYDYVRAGYQNRPADVITY